MKRRNLSSQRTAPEHVFTAFRLRTTFERLQSMPFPTPEAAANALIAYHEHAKAIGVQP